jgi:hypothetical protein
MQPVVTAMIPTSTVANSIHAKRPRPDFDAVLIFLALRCNAISVGIRADESAGCVFFSPPILQIFAT